MARTWQSVLDEARVILQDKEGDRWGDEIMLTFLNRGLQELYRLRPDIFWDFFAVDDTVVPEIVTTDPNPNDDAQVALSAAFNLNMMFHGPLVYWVTGNAELTDDEFTNDGRTALLLTQFKQQVLTL